MSDTIYRLVAWTENGEVRFSEDALQEQEALLWDEYSSLYYSGVRTPECIERLCREAARREAGTLEEIPPHLSAGRKREGTNLQI